jgi:hypothetical protein
MLKNIALALSPNGSSFKSKLSLFAAVLIIAVSGKLFLFSDSKIPFGASKSERIKGDLISNMVAKFADDLVRERIKPESGTWTSMLLEDFYDYACPFRPSTNQ